MTRPIVHTPLLSVPGDSLNYNLNTSIHKQMCELLNTNGDVLIMECGYLMFHSKIKARKDDSVGKRI